jgi:TPR repeat protein
MQENSDLHRNSRAVRIHREWLCDYYTALCPEPLPFAYAMNPTATLSEAPEYATAPVTDLMRANALQYLGECFFEGYGLPEDTAAAAACYRGVLTYAPKGVPTPPPAVVEATYSLGWCMLYGVGTAVNCPEAIRLLNSVSRNHAGACFTLGVCYEEGRGVVVADDHEAVKFYRKAQKMGHPRAAERIEELERRLRNHAEE